MPNTIIADTAGGPAAIGPPRPIQTFAKEEDRKRLTPAAVQAILSIAHHWKLTATEAANLLATSISTWERIRQNNWSQSFSQDQLMRASALIGVYRGLHLLFADDMADRWVRLRNAGALFGNLSPVEAMQDGGIPAMLDVRRYIDALRGGM